MDKRWNRSDRNSPLSIWPETFCELDEMVRTSIATGDQAMFMRKEFYFAAGGYPPLALMEDIAFCKRARRLSRPACLRERVLTSARRWEKYGVWRTIMLMWRLRLAYFLGADPEGLALRYGYRRKP